MYQNRSQTLRGVWSGFVFSNFSLINFCRVQGPGPKEKETVRYFQKIYKTIEGPHVVDTGPNDWMCVYFVNFPTSFYLASSGTQTLFLHPSHTEKILRFYTKYSNARYDSHDSVCTKICRNTPVFLGPAGGWVKYSLVNSYPVPPRVNQRDRGVRGV